MDYLRIYNELIESGRNVVKIKGVHETHHILPRSLGGTDDPENLTVLTYKGHIFAHRLLTRILVGEDRVKMLFGLNKILRRKGSKLTLREAAEARKCLSEAMMSNQLSKGLKYTDERRARLFGNTFAKNLKGYKQTKEHIEKRTNCRKGHKDTPTRPLICLNDSKVFRSSVDAAAFYGLHATSIRAVCLGKRKTTGKLKFAYI
jgi:hypothetical protein